MCEQAEAPPTQRVTVARHINEGNDLFGEDVLFPYVAEGDIVAMVGVGGYCQSMWTDHCGRPRAGALFFADRAC
jgi:diaminopimelate decarboxylase